MSVNTGTSKARHLGGRLRDARENAGIGLRRLATQLGMDPGLLSRFETGQRSPKPEVVATILATLGVSGDQRDEILALAHDTDGGVWLAISMPEQQRQLEALLDFERTAMKITDVSSLLIPGLLQTGDYARSIMVAAEVPAHQIETRVRVRVGRREALTRREPAHLLALICEPALRQMIGGPSVMVDQLRHLLAMATLPTVDLRIVPGNSGWHPGLEGPFVIDEFNGASPIVHLELRGSGLFLHEKDDVAAYQNAATKVLREAMSRDASVELITREAERIERIT